MTNHTTGRPPHRQPPTAVQCALAVVTAGLAVAAVMLALVGTAQANYLTPIPQDEPYPQDPVYNVSHSPTAPASSPAPAKPSCPPAPSATFSGSLRLLGQPTIKPLTLTASIDGQPWATATVSDGRYTIDMPQHTPDTPPCFPSSGTILFTLDGYTCMPAEEKEGERWVACGYRSFTPGPHDVDLVCLAAPTPTPSPTPTATPMLTSPPMPMPVEGTWWVTCGYRCGLHTEDYNTTFALDIIASEGESAGQPVRSPVDGQIVGVADSVPYFCHDEWSYGPEGGAVIAIDFQDPSGTGRRLRLAHLDPATIPDDLRPDDGPVPVEAGALLGNVAQIDDGCNHLHISLVRLEECREVPEPLTIEGKPLEDCGGENCWLGAQLPLESP
ncbi:MAG: hypothetical protein MUP14_09045 [Dehalococcoidia bacterium]|nr:hypothetical protein [Dehalococcoidia bacterium]